MIKIVWNGVQIISWLKVKSATELQDKFYFKILL